MKNARKPDKGVLVERPDVKIFLPFRFYFYRVEELFKPNIYNRFLVAPGGDHLISLIDEISYVSPPAPMISQLHDIPPEQFCNGDNRPPDCGLNCMCTHTVDIPLNAIVEVVLVDEGKMININTLRLAMGCLLRRELPNVNVSFSMLEIPIHHYIRHVERKSEMEIMKLSFNELSQRYRLALAKKVHMKDLIRLGGGD